MSRAEAAVGVAGLEGVFAGAVNVKGYMRDLLRNGLIPAMRSDLRVLRSFMRAMNLVQPPADLMGDPHIMQAALAAYEARHERPRLVRGPSRAERLEILDRVAS